MQGLLIYVRLDYINQLEVRISCGSRAQKASHKTSKPLKVVAPLLASRKTASYGVVLS